jgi:hypothetical protein
MSICVEAVYCEFCEGFLHHGCANEAHEEADRDQAEEEYKRAEEYAHPDAAHGVSNKDFCEEGK